MLDRGEAGRGWEAQNTRKAEIAGRLLQGCTLSPWAGGGDIEPRARKGAEACWAEAEVISRNPAGTSPT